MDQRSDWDEDVRPRQQPPWGSVVKLPSPSPATAGVAWATLAFAILACVLAGLALFEAGEARTAAERARAGNDPFLSGDIASLRQDLLCAGVLTPPEDLTLDDLGCPPAP